METQEAAEEYANKKGNIPTTELEDAIFKQGFIDGANWQEKRMYSQEEVVDLIADWTKMAKGLNMNFPSDKFEIWFEQFKKK